MNDLRDFISSRNDCARCWIRFNGIFGGVMRKVNKTMLTAAVTAVLSARLSEIESERTQKDIQAKLMQGLTKEREDWRKWRQSGSKNKSLINGRLKK